MLTKLRTLASLYRELGPRWTLFRLAYAFRLRNGFIRLQMPMGEWSDYQNRISEKSAGRVARVFFAGVSRPIEYPPNVPWNPEDAVDLAGFFVQGMLHYFSRQLVRAGFPPDWHKDYFSEYVASPPLQVNKNKHWSQISDDANGDIKFIWELNRFGFAYTLARAYVASHNEEFPAAFWTLIEDWAQHNPPNTGPNWMDGQEIALRLMAWTFGYNAFINSPSTTPERKEKFTLYIAAQAERIYKNIGYAISTRSNHTISEAFGLWMVGLLFPELKHAEKYLSLGKQLLEQEARNQIFPDGSYSMYSLNYHRFILHIYLYAIQLGEINDPSLREEHSSTKQSQTRFSDDVYQAVTKSIEYLAQLINPQTGEMPVYGSNDGALVLPLNNCDFTDYRPLLQLGWYITKKEFLFEPGLWDEDIFWLTGASAGRVARSDGEGRIETTKLNSFPNGGVYFLHNTNSHAILRCTEFTSRPSHADQLHMDLWIHGHNLAIDAGTYLYSGEGIWRNGLAHTSVHNTVTVDNKNQMTMVSRFTWTNWSKGKVLKHDKNLWQGEHDGYKPVSHQRTVMALDGDRWLVLDILLASEMHHYSLHWLLEDSGVEELSAPKRYAAAHGLLLSQTKTDSKLSDSRVMIQMGLVEDNGNFSIVRADPNSTRGWRSRYYGHKEPAISLMLEAHQKNVTFWTFFGFENDVVELEGNLLKVNAIKIQL